MVLLLITLVAPLVLVVSASTQYPIALPGCPDHCGNVSIPYPFGMGPKCSHDSWFEIVCNTTQPILAKLNCKYDGDYNLSTPLGINSIDVGTSPLPNNYVSNNNNNGPPNGTLVITGIEDGEASDATNNSFFGSMTLDMRRSPFVLMGGMRNSLLGLGCGGSAVLKNIHTGESVAGCSSVCNYNSSSSTPIYDQSVTSQQLSANVTGCYGVGCCQGYILTSLDYFQFEFLTTILQGSRDWSDMISATVVDTSYISNGRAFNATSIVLSRNAPIVLEWRVPDLPIHSIQYANSSCTLQENPPRGYSCKCIREYYTGNPYLPYGCQVFKECEPCPHNCVPKVVGNHKAYGCPHKTKKSSLPIALGLGISLGTLLLSIMLYGLYRLVKKRKEIKQMQKNFKRNGGMLLQQQMSTSKGSVERIKVFTCIDLERATDNFNENRILGRGGQGTVYKGMLVDGTIVAIKKSKKVDESQLGPFINEVVILSQVNHRNVVKLFGCCLETEVPLLVYEFIPNGTLFQHIHNPSEDFWITWKMRLQIATESSEALAYLHSSSNIPIYHRDIKTTNILLDDKYRAKISDFGTSKTILIDQTHVTTCVQGTFGYIDPEFFQSHQFTDKSDVYSFGIVLVELLTGKKPIYADRSSESRSLASEFLYLMQNSRLHDIVDGELLEEAQKEELDCVADLARQCLHLNGKQRPTMKEVATTLQNIFSKNHAINPSSKHVFKGKEDLEDNQISIKVDEGPSNNSSTIFSTEDPPYIQEQPLL